ncbi:hypothetical protein N7495_006813 [Penicillium taxi]|uniref:uncharacterized protein n=1 Tax=Penicillium taxi TaxID=168475 RepID=UPI0025454184|nr:uncharacterized protein N7495_006813 [Penicillium taxi]KAJ5895122.1 hypothetical protein N7495_006813 [Penicillium taxi]
MAYESKNPARTGKKAQNEDSGKNKHSLISLFSFTTQRHIPILTVGSIFAVFAGCVTPVIAIFLGNIFDAFTSFGANEIDSEVLRAKIMQSCLGLVGLGAAVLFLNGAYFMLFVAFGELQAASIRRMVFAELLKRDVEWFEAQGEGSGAFLSGIQAHIHDLQVATSQPLGLLIQYGCRVLASLILGFYTSWKLSLVTLAGIPLFSVLIAYLSTRMKSSITAQQDQLTHASKIAINAISSIDTIKCLNGQALESRSYASRIQQSAIHYLRQARLNSLQIALIRWMMFGMFVQGFWFGSSLARRGELSSGDVVRTFWACTTAAQSIEQVLPQVIVIEKAKVAALLLKLLVRDYSKDRFAVETKGRLCPSHCEGDIEVKNVSFSYPSQPDRCVLKPSSFFFPAGETTFVIGQSGSGKSTLGQLLMRFYAPTTGQILIDGNPLSSLAINWIRNNATLVEQRSVLFNDTIFHNIVLGYQNHDRKTVSSKDIQEAIDLAMLGNTIHSLPKGLSTSVGPGGSLLSGGQRQRVAIARAKLRDTPILILDEPTSALDQTNRVAVMKAIRGWRKNKTTIIITHEMSQIKGDDFIYILENGSIVQSGYRNDVEKQPGSEKYFHSKIKTKIKTPIAPSLSPARDSCSDTWSLDTLEDVEPIMPRRALHNRRYSWAQHHIPPGLRTSMAAVPIQGFALCSNVADGATHVAVNRQSLLFSPLNINPPEVTRTNYTLVPTDEIEMTQIDGYDSRSNGTLRRRSHGRRSKTRSLRRSQSLKSLHVNSSHNAIPLAPLSQIMSTIWYNLTWRERVVLILGIASALVHASATPIFSYCLSELIATFYVGKDSAKLSMRWSLAVLGVSIGDGASSFFMHYFLEYSAEAWMDTLRKEAFKRILDQPRVWFEKESNKSSRLSSYLNQNGEDMRNLLGRFAGFVIVAAAIMVIAIIWSFFVCWKLTLVALACGPAIYIITRGFEGSNGRWERRCNEGSSVAADIVTETFSEIQTVRTLTLEGYFHRKQAVAIMDCLRLGVKRAIYTGALFGLVEATIIFATALIFYYGGELAANLEFSVDDVVQVFSLLLFGIGYAAQISSWIPQINTSREIATNLIRLSELPKGGSHEHRGFQLLPKLTPIKFENLNFRYPSRPKTLVLKNVSMKISQNSCTAIVGRSGSGKSTIASLLLSLYEAPVSRDLRPTVTLGEEDILRLHVPTLRSQIAIVSQQPTIFPATIFANINYGIDDHSPLASLAAVRVAAQAAGIDEFIASLPMGYSTVIGDGGIGLSGGQKQRVVIARAILRNPQILILDEATSSLDPVSAEVVRQTVQQLVSTRQDLTVIIITHSREMIQIADHVIVLDQGVVVEDGTYKTLSQRVGGKLFELMNDPEDSGEM